MKRFFWPALLVAGLTLAACGGTTASPGGNPTASPAAAPDITTASITVAGRSVTVLKNPKGLTLYYFTPDTSAKVACTGGCATTWPPLIATSDTPSASPTLPGKLTVLNGANGRQILYNGHPLYMFGRDSGQADALGQGIGGKWFVATPDLAVAPSAAKYNY
jgi:predicted lipoprotein with Yx(FWY)xxD motif